MRKAVPNLTNESFILDPRGEVGGYPYPRSYWSLSPRRWDKDMLGLLEFYRPNTNMVRQISIWVDNDARETGRAIIKEARWDDPSAFVMYDLLHPKNGTG